MRIRATLVPEAPLAGLEIALLPFDPDALLDSLAAGAPTPQPGFPELEQSLRAFTPSSSSPNEPVRTPTSVAAAATLDSVLKLSAALRRMDRAAPDYRAVYNRFRDLYARYSSREAARDTEMRGNGSGDRALAQRAARAADSLRRWEQGAYKDFPRLAAERSASRAPLRLKTDSSGIAHAEVVNGHWWLSARAPDPSNPFMELHWNVPVTAAGLPFGFPVSMANAVVRWRH